MLGVLSVISPIFLLMLIGFACAKRGLISISSVSQMGRFVLYIALPAVIIKTLLNLELSQIFNARFLLSYLLASSLLIAVVCVLLFRGTTFSRVDSSIMMMGMVVPNSAFIGYPILLQLMDEPPVSAFAMALIIENLLIIPFCFILLDFCSLNSPAVGLTKRFISVFKRSAKNPLLISIVIGVLGNVLQISLPKPLESTLDLLAPSAVAVALFVIGGTLSGITIKDTHRGQVVMVAIAKLIIHPILAMLMLHWLLPGEKHLSLALIVMTSVPMLSIYTIVGELYGRANFCATVQLVTTTLSIFTIPIVLYVAQHSFLM